MKAILQGSKQPNVKPLSEIRHGELGVIVGGHYDGNIVLGVEWGGVSVKAIDLTTQNYFSRGGVERYRLLSPNESVLLTQSEEL